MHLTWQKCFQSQIKRPFLPSPIAMLFTVHTWAVKPKQHCTRDIEGGEFVPFGQDGCMERNWKMHWNASTLLSWVVDFFCGGSEKNRFQWLHKEQFQNFLELYLRGRIYCFFNKFQLKLLQLNTALLNPHFFEPPDNSKQKSFPSPSSDTVILVTPDFSKYPIFRTNFRFTLRFEKFGFICNFGMIIRSLDVRIGSVFVLRWFECVCTTYSFGHCVIFFRAIRSPLPQVQRCPYAYAYAHK